MNQIKLKSEIPEKYISSDLYHVKTFVNNLYTALESIDVAEKGFCFLLNGKWGSGKSTIVNFLKEKNDRSFIKTSIRILDYSPWNITDKQSLIKNFFNTLTESIYEQSKDKKVIELFNKYYDCLIDGLKIVPKVEKYIPLINSIKNLICNSKPQSIDSVKKEITEYLVNTFDKKLVIVIDDLDRVTHEDLYTVIQLIKEIGDFPKCIYLVSADQNYIMQSINMHFKKENDLKFAESYIKKIFQLKWDIPEPDSEACKKYLFNRLKDIVGNDIFQIENEYLEKVFTSYFLKENFDLRIIKTSLNCFFVNWENKKNYVNFVDLFILSYLQMNNNMLFEIIRENRKLLVQNSVEGNSNANKNIQENKKRYDLLCRNLTENEISLLESIFYVLPINIGKQNITYPSNPYIHQYLGSEFCFDTYFHFKITKELKSSEELLNIVKSKNSDLVTYIMNGDYITHSTLRLKLNTLADCCNFLNYEEEICFPVVYAVFCFFNYQVNYLAWYKNYLYDLVGKRDAILEKSILFCLNNYEIESCINSILKFLYDTKFNDFSFEHEFNYELIISTLISKVASDQINIFSSSKFFITEFLLTYNKIQYFNDLLKFDSTYSIYCILHFFNKADLGMSDFYGLVSSSKSVSELWSRFDDGVLSNMVGTSDYLKEYVKSKEYNALDFRSKEQIDLYYNLIKEAK